MYLVIKKGPSLADVLRKDNVRAASTGGFVGDEPAPEAARVYYNAGITLVDADSERAAVELVGKSDGPNTNGAGDYLAANLGDAIAVELAAVTPPPAAAPAG